MQMSALGWMGKYTWRDTWGLQLGASYVLSGRNVGQATTLSAALLYTLQAWGAKEATN